jgi:hypothetical protein
MIISKGTIMSKSSPYDSGCSDFSFLNPTGFKLVIPGKDIDHFEYTIQKVNLPDINVNNIVQSTRVRDIPLPGSRVEFSSLSLDFLVDERMLNYKEIFNWLLSLVNGESDLRDLSLHILSSHNNVTNKIKFVSAFPTSLTSINFDSTLTNTEYVTCSVTFEYSYFAFV